MPSFYTLGAAALALLQVTGATPVDLLEKRKAFTVHQVEKGKVQRILPNDIAKTIKKFGGTVPAHVEAAQRAAASGSVAAVPEDQYDSLYLSPVSVGGKTLQLDFDTGSADLWVFSSLQSSSQTSGHDIYTADSSKLKSGYSWKISYGDGSSASGKVYADTVVVGGVTAVSQAVEAATSVSSSFLTDKDDDGLLGLAFSSINTVSPTKQKTFFDNVKSSLASPLFAVTLKKGQAGSYDFGYLDASKYTGSITYVSVDSSQGFWGLSATGYAVGSGSTVSASISAIADTGTTLIYLPAAIVKAYYAKVSGASYSSTYAGYVFPCSATLPSFTVVIGGVKQVVPGSYLNYAPASGTTCFGGLQDDSDIGISILGDVFLKSKYVVFENSGSPRIGFAQQAGVSA